MSIAQYVEKNKRIIPPFILANIYFLSIAQHTAQFWERPLLAMIGSWVVCVPLLTWAMFLLLKQVTPHLKKIDLKYSLLFIIPTLLIGAFVTWRYYKLPVTFHTLTITPLVSKDQRVELIEIKVNGNIIPLNEKRALEYGWQTQDDILVATAVSQPLKISFRVKINAPVTVLFYGSPQSGKAQISLDNQQLDVDLNRSDNRQTTTSFKLRSYRGVPNWIFIPLLLLVDMAALASFFYFIFRLQESGQAASNAPGPGGATRFVHRRNILILLGIAGILHLLNALAVPLLIDADSPSYLQGALHWLQYGNLDGVSMVRGPGTTFLLMPIVLLFGRNPWGVKILLHLIAFACVPVSYRLGWQLSKDQRVAFLCGLATALSPDLFFYSNFLMSDLPNLFFVLVFCTLLISALEAFEWNWVLATFAVASFASLLRGENITLFLIGAAVLFMVCLWRWKINVLAKPVRDLGIIALTFLVMTLPLLWWSAHNQRVYHYFGLSNYAGEVIYDGWVYFGDASRLDFSDQNSAAVREIRAVLAKYPANITDKSGVATAMETYPSLIKAGYTPRDGIHLMQQATIDSIQKDWPLTYKLLLIKLRAGLRPETTGVLSLPLASESFASTKMGYFDDEGPGIPALILVQRKAYEYIQSWYSSYFMSWVYFCLVAMFFSLYRSPRPIWLTLILIISTRIFLPNILGLSHWRYTLAGWIPLQVIAICWMAAIVQAAPIFSGKHNSNEAPHAA